MSNLFDFAYHLSVEIQRDLQLAQPPFSFVMRGPGK